jgi:hypothetical protein
MPRPIHTYGGDGLLKRGVQPEDHAVIFTSQEPHKEEGEVPGHSSIKMDPIDQSQKLDPMSRLNYAKVYTVEHNVKVWFIGAVKKSYLQRLMTSYDEVHRPLSDVHSQYIGMEEQDEEPYEYPVEDSHSQGDNAEEGRRGSHDFDEPYDSVRDDHAYATSPSAVAPIAGMAPRSENWTATSSSAGASPSTSYPNQDLSRFQSAATYPLHEEEDDIYNA